MFHRRGNPAGVPSLYGRYPRRVAARSGEEPGDPPDAWQAQREALGEFIRTQRRLANLTLREMAELADVSNPYLSQIERGLHAPSVRVLQSIATALNLSADMVLARAGFGGDEGPGDSPGDPGASAGEGSGAGAGAGRAPAAPGTEAAIRTDPRLTDEQKETLLAVYRSYVGRPL